MSVSLNPPPDIASALLVIRAYAVRNGLRPADVIDLFNAGIATRPMVEFGHVWNKA